MVEPARGVDGVGVVAIGARDPERARAFADRLDLPAWGDYDAVLADPRVDLVYLALPPVVHAEWATRALAAGKHVLCEKPLSANGTTAAAIADAADAAGRRAFVGFHYRLHGFIADLLDTIGSGVLGEVKLVEIDFSIPHFVVQPGNIRLDGDLAGGAVMDVGCYAVDLMRAAWGELEVVSATAQISDADPRIDLQTDAELRLPGGIPALLRASFLGDDAGGDVGAGRWQRRIALGDERDRAAVGGDPHGDLDRRFRAALGRRGPRREQLRAPARAPRHGAG
nr:MULTISPECIES: Gfo/Idh/MocA family oxidoreductase [unclassified Microbacterium]